LVLGLFDYLYIPLSLVLIILVLIAPLIVIYLFIRLSEAAFEQVGFDHRHAAIAVFGSILGSLVDIPLHSGPISSYPGWFVSAAEIAGQTFPTTFQPLYLAVNVGGCLIPLAISADLLRRHKATLSRAVAGILSVAIITYLIARPVANEGIVLPIWLSPSLAAASGLLLAKGFDKTPSLAYISGTIGTLLGADIFNLLTPGVLPSLSPIGEETRPLVLSIGGAGVFDGIFLTGILAVLLAAGIVCLFHGKCETALLHRHAKR
jgi:uncharacterized membrane protein